MIRRRTIEVHIERHELSIFSNAASSSGTATDPSTQSPPDSAAWPCAPIHTGSSAEAGSVLGTASVPHPRPTKTLCCPICGADEMLPLAEAIAVARLTATALKEGLETGRYHLHCSLTGEWMVCIQSMERTMQED